MRVLVIADVHGNAAALDTVLSQPHDHLICLGDIVGYGPSPAACVDAIRAQPGFVVQGNHDRAIADNCSPGCRPAFSWLADATRHIALHELGPERLTFLGALPRWARVLIDEVDALCLHATPTNPLYRYLGAETSAWGQEVASVNTPLLLVGHTHLQFGLQCESTRVINPGSVGQPKDADPRAAFAIIEDGEISLHRVAYDVEATVRGLEESDTPRDAVAALARLLRTGTPPPAQEPTTNTV